MDNTEMFTLRFSSYPSFEATQVAFAKIGIFLSISPVDLRTSTPYWRGYIQYKAPEGWTMHDTGCYPFPQDCKEPLIRMAVEYCLKNDINFLNIE